MKRFAKQILIIFLSSLLLSLSGCIFVAGAVAGAAAIAVVYDHRTLQRAYDDSQLTNKISEKLNAISALRDESHIEVAVFNQIVLLIGETPHSSWRQQAEEIARTIVPSARIYNQIKLQRPTSSLTRTSDAWITTKIKSQMLATQDLKSGSIKVLTENGVVYLMGVVNRDQAAGAVDIARQVSGVQKVVKVFQYKN
jgi:osmotically-inducible protein OsmY